jgi:hypothetical protein
VTRVWRPLVQASELLDSMGRGWLAFILCFGGILTVDLGIDKASNSIKGWLNWSTPVTGISVYRRRLHMLVVLYVYDPCAVSPLLEETYMLGGYGDFLRG